MNYHLLIILPLALVGFIAGFVDTLAGGGGLITVPALLTAGLPPALALGTNRVQACVGELNASLHFLRHKKLDLKLLLPGLLLTALGSSLGAVLVQWIHPVILGKIIPFLLLAVFIYILVSPRPPAENTEPRLSAKIFFLIFGSLLGFYNGFFGPGTGSFWMVALMFFLGMNIVNATIHAKPLNAIGSVVGAVWFIIGGNVDYPIAIVMAIGQLIGSRVAAGLVIHKGHALIRPLFIAVVAIMTVELFIKYYF